MGGDMIPRAIEMAREIRRGEAEHSPSVLHGVSLGRADIYRHAMWEAGYVVPSDTNRASAVCEICGYDFGASAPVRVSATRQDGWAISLDDPDLTNDERAAIEWCIGKRSKPGAES